MSDKPMLEQFRVDVSPSGVAHLIFDAPNRSMNVFSNAAIRDLGIFAEWVKRGDVHGVVVRSGKSSAFCAGADLAELGQAYDMIMAAPAAERFQIAFDHFFALSLAIRALETCGKPVAVAVAGLALGGGCELALGAHYRVATDSPATAFGLPESLVGLLPGAGGTQRLPRIVGLDLALPVLLEGKRFSSQEALAAGLVHEIVAPGNEVAAAEAWVLSTPAFGQPWDVYGWVPGGIEGLNTCIAICRQAILEQTLGHYPAPLAILECVERGLPQPFDKAIRSEMTIFSGLIQRPEPRDMIAVMFHAKTDYERRKKKGELPPEVDSVASTLARLWLNCSNEVEAAALAAGGFILPGVTTSFYENVSTPTEYWFDQKPNDSRKVLVRALLERIVTTAELYETEVAGLTGLVDYAAVTKFGFPSYLGGPFAFRNGMRDRK